MDYKKEYESMVQRARELHEAGNALTKQQMEIVCPELKESENERMISELQGFLASFGADYFGTGKWQKFDDWLEKQKEQKLITFEEPYNSDEYEVVEIGDATCLRRKEQQPAEWSEEDERIRLACIATINDVIDYERDRWEDYNPGKPYRPITKYDEQIDWLKSLRPRTHWKPSEEQIEALKNIAYGSYQIGDGPVLRELYDNLKKL